MFTIPSAQRGTRPETQAAAEDKAAVTPTSGEAKGDEREGLATRTKSDAARDKLKEELNAFNQYGQHKVTLYYMYFS